MHAIENSTRIAQGDDRGGIYRSLLVLVQSAVGESATASYDDGAHTTLTCSDFQLSLTRYSSSWSCAVCMLKLAIRSINGTDTGIGRPFRRELLMSEKSASVSATLMRWIEAQISIVKKARDRARRITIGGSKNGVSVMALA